MALARNTPPTGRDARGFSDPMKAGAVIYEGAIVVLDAAGFAIPGTTIAGGATVVRGVAIRGWDNSAGADGAATIETRRGCYLLANGDAITRADIGDTCFVVDDETVAKADAGATRIAAGVIRDVDAAGVWVEI